MKENLQKVIEQFVDLLMPEITPYEANLYLLLFRDSFLQNGTLTIRIGKRRLSGKIGKGARTGENISIKQVDRSVKGLEEKGIIKVGDTNRDGTLYTVLLPLEIPLVKEKLSIAQKPEEENYFTDQEKRKEVFERDKWACFYCGEKVTSENATLDHLTPQSKGGKHTKDNLKTSCLVCNSIKSGKTYEEAAPYLLKSIQDRRQKAER